MSTYKSKYSFLTSVLMERLAQLGYSEDSKPSIEYRPFDGWYLLAPEPRYFGDPGDYLGSNWADAESALRIYG